MRGGGRGGEKGAVLAVRAPCGAAIFQVDASDGFPQG